MFPARFNRSQTAFGKPPLNAERPDHFHWLGPLGVTSAEDAFGKARHSLEHDIHPWGARSEWFWHLSSFWIFHPSSNSLWLLMERGVTVCSDMFSVFLLQFYAILPSMWSARCNGPRPKRLHAHWCRQSQRNSHGRCPVSSDSSPTHCWKRPRSLRRIACGLAVFCWKICNFFGIIEHTDSFVSSQIINSSRLSVQVMILAFI